MNIFKRLFSKKNRNNRIKDNGISSEPKIDKYFTTSDINKINNQLLKEIYVEDVDTLYKNNKSIVENDELILYTDVPSVNDSKYERIDIPTMASTGTDNINSTKDSKAMVSNATSIDSSSGSTANCTDVSFSKCSTSDSVKNQSSCSIKDATTREIINDMPLKPSKRALPNLSRGICNINSVSGVEDILNKIIKELNKIIVQREDLKLRLKLKENSYKIVKRKFNTILSNKLYRPIKLVQ